MTKEEKFELVKELTEKFKSTPNFYIADTGGLTVAQVNELRGLCYESDVQMQVVKNTLIRKALEQLDVDFTDLFSTLKQQSTVFFTSEENPSVPAKVIKKFRENSEKPILKAACIDTAIFTGDDQLDTLSDIKSKGELVGEIVGLLQSPAKNVISALKSGGSTIAGLIKTLSEREEAA